MEEKDTIGKSWYTKYRPKRMSEYLGDGIKNIVAKRFKRKENMPHVIFIHGNRGCGKTTFARLISKQYMCENLSENGEPCEECDMCKSINEILIDGEAGNVECPGVTEIDATVMNGKEAIQEVLDDAVQTPMYSEFKVLIIDEVHMVTPQAQNSMLKILEDIPKHLVVIFCTTNPEKVLQTIKSRCQLTLEAKKQSVSDMSKRLREISEIEGLKTSYEALEIIAKKGDRVPRECINLLETIAKTYDNEVTIENVKDYIVDISGDMYLDYFNAANTGLGEILQFNKGLKEKNIKVQDFVNGLMGFVLDSMYIKHGISLEDYPKEYIGKIKKVFEIYNSSDFDMLLQIIEYLSNMVTGEDSNKNEVLLTTTAMRISKIKLMAKGLSEEYREAVIENKISLLEHSKKLRADNSKVVEQLKVELGDTEISESFEDAVQVVESKGLFDNIVVPDVVYNEPEEVQNEVVGGSKELDDFFDN